MSWTNYKITIEVTVPNDNWTIQNIIKQINFVFALLNIENFNIKTKEI